MVDGIDIVRGIQNRIWVKITTFAATRAPGLDFVLLHPHSPIPSATLVRGAAIPRINYPLLQPQITKDIEYGTEYRDRWIDRDRNKSLVLTTISHAFDEYHGNFPLSWRAKVSPKFMDRRLSTSTRYDAEKTKSRCVCTYSTIGGTKRKTLKDVD